MSCRSDLEKPALLWLAFVANLLFAVPVRPTFRNDNHPGEMSGFTDEDYQLVIEEGRIQLGDQGTRFAHTTARAQMLVTVSLVAVASWVGVLAIVAASNGSDSRVGLFVWAIGGTALLFGLAAAGGVITAAGSFERVDTTQLSHEEPGPGHLATEYASAVRRGEVTLADRVTAFRQATRLVVWGSLLTALTAAIAI